MKIQHCCNFEICANGMINSGEMIIINKEHLPILGVITKRDNILTLSKCPGCGKKLTFEKVINESSQ